MVPRYYLDHERASQGFLGGHRGISEGAMMGDTERIEECRYEVVQPWEDTFEDAPPDEQDERGDGPELVAVLSEN